jgi:hypothetical protein
MNYRNRIMGRQNLSYYRRKITWDRHYNEVWILAVLLLAASTSSTHALLSLQPYHQRHLIRPPQVTMSVLEAKKGGRPKRKASSFATQSIQDSQRAQQILRNRSARGSPQLILDELPEDIATMSSRNVVKARQIRRNAPKTAHRMAALQSATATSEVKTQNIATEEPESPANGIDFPYDLTLLALQVYHDENGNLCLPRRFLVPQSDAYPSAWHGLDLAGTVYNMRWWQKHVKQRSDRVSQLNKLGFLWERLQPEWNLILESLIVYRGMYGNLLVPSNFTVPFNDDSWPKPCWGIALGSVVFKIRNRNDHLRDFNTAWKRREQLDRIGFVWDVQELRFNKFCAALKLYAKIEQDNEMSLEQQLQKHAAASPQLFALKIPSKFVVPRSSQWPNQFWGYRLGERCTQVRQKQLYVKGHPDRIKILADLGFYMSSGNDSLKWLKVVHAAALYSQMHGNRLDVQTKFVVPAPKQIKAECAVCDEYSRVGDKLCIVGSDDAWPWPEYLWGFPLGQRLRDIRVKGYFLRGGQASIRRRQLDALGFKWEPPRGRPRKQKLKS